MADDTLVQPFMAGCCTARNMAVWIAGNMAACTALYGWLHRLTKVGRYSRSNGCMSFQGRNGGKSHVFGMDCIQDMTYAPPNQLKGLLHLQISLEVLPTYKSPERCFICHVCGIDHQNGWFQIHSQPEKEMVVDKESHPLLLKCCQPLLVLYTRWGKLLGASTSP